MPTAGPNNPRSNRRGLRRSKWPAVLFCLAFGLVFFAIEAANHHVGQGFIELGIMLAAGAGVLLGGRSETIRGLRGDGRDERFDAIDERGTAFAGRVVIVAVVVGGMIQVADNHSGAPYTWLAALAGGAYIAAIVWQRLHG